MEEEWEEGYSFTSAFPSVLTPIPVCLPLASTFSVCSEFQQKSWLQQRQSSFWPPVLTPSHSSLDAWAFRGISSSWYTGNCASYQIQCLIPKQLSRLQNPARHCRSILGRESKSPPSPPASQGVLLDLHSEGHLRWSAFHSLIWWGIVPATRADSPV